MTKLVLFAVQMFLSVVSTGQAQLLKNYDFDRGGYSLIGIRQHNDQNGLADTLGNFYTDDVLVLNQIKREWVFDQKIIFGGKCGFDYEVYICKDCIGLESFFINLACKKIDAAGGIFLFEPEKLEMFKDKLKTPVREQVQFNSLLEARDRRIKMLSDEKLIWAQTPDWAEYEGRFSFIHTAEKRKGMPSDDMKQLLQELSDEVKKNYPGEPFELNCNGWSIRKAEKGNKWSTFESTIDVKSNKSLVDKFNLYPFGWIKWEAYKPELIVYWREK